MPLDYAALPQTALLPAESAGQLTVQLELPDTLEAVSYTHLDVYKRQPPDCAKPRPAAEA